MKKIIFMLLMISSLHAYAVVEEEAESTPITSTNAAIAVQSGIIASQIAAESANAAHKNQINQVVSSSNNEAIKGVIQCDAYYQKNNNGDYIYDGCEDRNDNQLSFSDYFNRYKPNDANQITMIIFDNYNDRFDIYYK